MIYAKFGQELPGLEYFIQYVLLFHSSAIWKKNLLLFLSYTCKIDYDMLCEKTILYVYISVGLRPIFAHVSPLTVKGCQIQAYARHLMRFEQGAIFIVPQLFVKRGHFFTVLPRGPSQFNYLLQQVRDTKDLF